jgi:hypothetical protein
VDGEQCYFLADKCLEVGVWDGCLREFQVFGDDKTVTWSSFIRRNRYYLNFEMNVKKVSQLLCRRCKKIKPIADFNRAAFGKRGFDIYCNECRTILDDQRKNLTEKQCRNCHRTLPITDFGCTESTRDGYYRECLDCQEENVHRRRERRAKGSWHGEMATCTLCGMLKPTYDMNPPRFENSKTRYCHACITKMVQHKIEGYESTREENGWRIQKRCTSCGQMKPSDQFHLDRRQKDGFSGLCLSCHTERLSRRTNLLKERHKHQNPHNLKECSICHALKPLTRFAKNENNVDGRSLFCRDCSVTVRDENAVLWKQQRTLHPHPEVLQCNRCGRTLPISKFTKTKERKNGYLHRCIDCTKAEEKRIFSNWEHQREQGKFEISLHEKTEKICRSCKRTLPLSEFYQRQASKDGRNHYCRDCLEKKVKERRRRLIEQGFPASLIPDEKQCSYCTRLLPQEMFSRDATQPDGLDTRCKDCRNTYRREYDARPEIKARMYAYKHRPEAMEKARERARRHAQKPEVKARQRAYKREYKKRPYVQEKRRFYDRIRSQRPHVKAKKKAYDASPKAKARRRKSTAAWQQRKRMERQDKNINHSPNSGTSPFL